MRSTLHGPEVYLQKSRKPHIQALLARLPEMSLDDIEKLDEKSDIKKGLLIIKKSQGNTDAALRAEQLANIMIAAHHPELLKNDSKQD